MSSRHHEEAVVTRARRTESRSDARRPHETEATDPPVAAHPPVASGAQFSAPDFPVQRAVSVGAVADPLELEADAVARSVVAALRKQGGGPGGHQHGSGCGCGAPGRPSGIAVRRHVGGHAGAAADVGEPVIGFAGGDLGAGAESRLRASAGTGTPIPQTLRAPLEHTLGADFSAVRLHTDAEASSLNRGMSALAFTHGADVYFRDGMPDTESDAGLHLLAHELTHTVQQGTAPVRRFADAIGVRRSPAGPLVQRHAAYEHYLLGQLQPDELASIPQVRKIKDNAGQKKNVKKGHDKGLTEGPRDKQALKEVRHLIDQEMDRLLEYKKDPEAIAHRIGEKGTVDRRRDGAWGVPIVVLTCRDGEEVVVTYSEMNTMPDLFGNPEAIEATPKKRVLALLQGVRQQLYIELSNIRKELFGHANSDLHNTLTVDDDFKGAAGPRSQAVIDKAYEVRTEKQVNSATTRPGEEYEQYFAALERNACHFAPESWNQWRGYHEKAVALAKKSAMNKRLADSGWFAGSALKNLQKEAADLANQALIQNSFGEHYLQDSFASGHLIDKTKIMQWFALWLEKNGKGLGTGYTASAQWKMAIHAAQMDLKSNPQALHDMGVRGELAGPEDAQNVIGMSSGPEIKFMMRWRALVQHDEDLRTILPSDAAKRLNVSQAEARKCMGLLLEKGFVERSGSAKFSLLRTQSQAANPKKGLAKPQAVNAYTATRGTNPGQDGTISGREASAAAAEFNLAAYNALLSNAYVGSSTKFFHDMFCKQGLQVMSGTGVELGRIYGDSNMLNAGGQQGVEYSAETSRRSRSSVFNIISGEERDEKYTTDDIQKRFPAKVKVYGSFVSVKDFNEELHRLGDASLFSKAEAFSAKLVYKAMGSISDKGALDVEMLVKEIGPLDDASSF